MNKWTYLSSLIFSCFMVPPYDLAFLYHPLPPPLSDFIFYGFSIPIPNFSNVLSSAWHSDLTFRADSSFILRIFKPLSAAKSIVCFLKCIALLHTISNTCTKLSYGYWNTCLSLSLICESSEVGLMSDFL